ncbi:hypothetical protein HDE_02288 [Halotydeus destructor]|nr:hypothetical protein HDE_02288 [Halotydeus destructor]
MKVVPVFVPLELNSSWNDTLQEEEPIPYAIDADKLILVLSITFGFIFFLLISLLCIFYFMGFMQNQFGWTWGNPMGRTISAPLFPDETLDQNGRYNHVVPPRYGVAHQC